MTLSADERARDVVTRLCGARAAENWVNREAVLNHLHEVEQEARAAADAEWATKLGEALADGEAVAEQRGAERAAQIAETVSVAAAERIRARGKQTETA